MLHCVHVCHVHSEVATSKSGVSVPGDNECLCIPSDLLELMVSYH